MNAPAPPLDLDALEKRFLRMLETRAMANEKELHCGGLSREAHNARRDAQAAKGVFDLELPRHFPALIAAARTLQNLRDGQECDGYFLARRITPEEEAEQQRFMQNDPPALLGD